MDPDREALLTLVARARPMVDRLVAAAPDWNVARSVQAQLAHIGADVERAQRPTADVLARINIGLYAVRDFETSNPPLADVPIEIANRYEEWAAS